MTENTLVRVGRRSLPIGRLELVETDNTTVQRLPSRTGLVDFGHDAAEQEVSVVIIPAKSVLESVFFLITEAFDGDLNLGVDGDPDNIIDDNVMEKGIALTPDVIMVGKYFATETEVILTVGIGTTGAGSIGYKVTRYEA